MAKSHPRRISRLVGYGRKVTDRSIGQRGENKLRSSELSIEKKGNPLLPVLRHADASVVFISFDHQLVRPLRQLAHSHTVVPSPYATVQRGSPGRWDLFCPNRTLQQQGVPKTPGALRYMLSTSARAPGAGVRWVVSLDQPREPFLPPPPPSHSVCRGEEGRKAHRIALAWQHPFILFQFVCPCAAQCPRLSLWLHNLWKDLY